PFFAHDRHLPSSPTRRSSDLSTSIGSVSPSPMPHIADDRLPALVHRDVLDPDGLIASAPVSLERLHLRRKSPAELIESTLCAILDRKSTRLNSSHGSSSYAVF